MGGQSGQLPIQLLVAAYAPDLLDFCKNLANIVPILIRIKVVSPLCLQFLTEF